MNSCPVSLLVSIAVHFSTTRCEFFSRQWVQGQKTLNTGLGNVDIRHECNTYSLILLRGAIVDYI